MTTDNVIANPTATPYPKMDESLLNKAKQILQRSQDVGNEPKLVVWDGYRVMESKLAAKQVETLNLLVQKGHSKAVAERSAVFDVTVSLCIQSLMWLTATNIISEQDMQESIQSNEDDTMMRQIQEVYDKLLSASQWREALQLYLSNEMCETPVSYWNSRDVSSIINDYQFLFASGDYISKTKESEMTVSSNHDDNLSDENQPSKETEGNAEIEAGTGQLKHVERATESIASQKLYPEEEDGKVTTQQIVATRETTLSVYNQRRQSNNSKQNIRQPAYMDLSKFMSKKRKRNNPK